MALQYNVTVYMLQNHVYSYVPIFHLSLATDHADQKTIDNISIWNNFTNKFNSDLLCSYHVVAICPCYQCLSQLTI